MLSERPRSRQRTREDTGLSGADVRTEFILLGAGGLTQKGQKEPFRVLHSDLDEMHTKLCP